MSALASRTGAAGASGPVSEVGTSLLSDAPGPAFDLPAAARSHSPGRILLLRGAAPALHLRVLPAPPQPPS